MSRPAPECITIGSAQLWLGDCRDVLPLLAPVSAVVTDPPYGLRFMGKRWDYDVPDSALWALVLDRLLPGGHLLAFAGTRTQHRMAVRIEDAGFEIRDMLAWVYGSGFPKSLDVGKAIDKAAGAEREIVGSKMSRIPGGNTFAQDEWTNAHRAVHLVDATAPATDAARQWDGWGTALKPALEPITLARKPLAGTVAANVLAHGTGGLNIDGCRVPGEAWQAHRATGLGSVKFFTEGDAAVIDKVPHDLGRWPANLIHDGSDEVVALFPQTTSTGTAGTGKSGTYGAFERKETGQPVGFGDTGSAARFFYCAKASRADRNDGLEGREAIKTDDGRKVPADNAYQRGKTERQNHHPTVKPTELMRWLCRLVTPPGGMVLDPFMGSGSTGVAAAQLGMRFVGIERERRYFDIACERIAAAQAQMPLFEPQPGPPAPAAAAADGAPQLGMFDGGE